MRVHFVLIGEGSSDEALVPHLQRLCVECGADEATGVAPDFSRVRAAVKNTVADKLRAALLLEPEATLYFIHRDADVPLPDARRMELASAVAAAALHRPWVALVPVQETEAWLLLDEAAIRQVAGNPRGRRDLRLPRPSEVENVSRPKERLQEALIIASETTGRRLENFKKDFARHRRLLLQRLPTSGALREVPAWQRLRAELTATLHAFA
jgi:hypothetical protein